MNAPWRIPVTTLAAVGMLLVGLVGCRALPLPIEIDLLEELGEARSGVVEEPVRNGVHADLHLDLPEHGDNCLAIDQDQLPVSVVHAQLTYAVDLRYEGPAVSGVVDVQPYLASTRTMLWTDGSALGERVTVDLASTSVELSGVARLTPDQLAGLNEGRLCWGVRLRGTDVAAASDGTIRASYEVRALVVRAGVAVF
jgi:hypothetical protein